tara:strand:- start:22946 stop:23887 length:942 start_codon:yes stop_codon:yes gene_type:complete
MKIISLVPSATEILCAIGLEDSIYGITHECIFPTTIKKKKIILSTKINFKELNNIEIDTLINKNGKNIDSIYILDIDEIKKIQPDYIITQDLCGACSITPKEINEIASNLKKKPQIITMSPKSIEDINESIIDLSSKLGSPKKGIELVSQINTEIKDVLSYTKNTVDRPRVFCMDWMNPIFSAGHWIPEMVHIAGGQTLETKNNASIKITFDELLNFAPNYIFIMPCGYDIERTTNEINLLLENPELNKIPAFNMGQVYIVNANEYFSKPSHRIVEGIKIMTKTINRQSFKYEPHPDAILNLQNYIHFESFAG